MAIELSNLTFTDENDIVVSEIEEILNTGIANTLAGNDSITGIPTDSSSGSTNGVYNSGTLNTDDGNDIITGISSLGNWWANRDPETGRGIYNTIGTIETGNGNDIITGVGLASGIQSLSGTINTGDDDDTIMGDAGVGGPLGTGFGIWMVDSTLDTGKGNDVIKGMLSTRDFGYGLLNGNGSTLTTGDGNDIIISEHNRMGVGISNDGLMDTGNGNDSISGTNLNRENLGSGISNSKDITTGDGEDYISGTGSLNGIINSGIINTDNGADIIFGSVWDGSGIINSGIINTGNDPDFMESSEGLYNTGNVFLGEGNDLLSGRGIYNYNFIGTGDGNDDIITSVIYNDGVIETGNGDDSILISGIFNNSGAINMGDGNDVIRDFDSDPNSSGAWFLGEGDDYIQLGSANGDFYGGSGNDTLHLVFGTYTVGIGGEGGESLIFTRGDQVMITSEFETLKVGSTIYDFTSLTAGQIIVA
jgi:hypothetical protein